MIFWFFSNLSFDFSGLLFNFLGLLCLGLIKLGLLADLQVDGMKELCMRKLIKIFQEITFREV